MDRKSINAVSKVPYSKESGEKSRGMLVLVEGPNGGFHHMVVSSYSAAMFVVGGSGITF